MDQVIDSVFPETPKIEYQVPDVYRYPLFIFEAMHKRKQEGLNGKGLLTYREILDWEEVHKEQLSNWERKTIIAIDQAWFDQVAIEKGKNK